LVSLVEVAVQAIGSEVAAETNSSAVMNAPARAVAALRVELKVMNIVSPLEFRVAARPSGHAAINARGVPNLKTRVFSMSPIGQWQELVVNPTSSWKN
jgi:hypothetical protein